MFITAHEYFVEKFKCSGNYSHCTSFIEQNFENFFSVASMLPVMLMSLLNIYIQSKVSFRKRMLVSLLMMLALFVLTSALVKVETHNYVDLFFAGTLLTIVFMSVFSGLFQSSTFGYAGILPQKYTAAVMSGQAFAGIFSSLARIISTVATGGHVELSALLYFLSAVVVILLCLASLILLLKLKFVKYYLNLTSVRTIQSRATQTEINKKTSKKDNMPFKEIFCDVLVYSLSVFLVFFVTLSLFPAVLSSIKSVEKYPDASIWTGKLFDALVCFLMFNSSDFVGRYLSNWFKMTGKWRFLLLALTLLRFLFVPLLLWCNVQPRSIHFHVLFHNDVWPILFITALGLSNGFLASVCMVSAPQNVKEEFRETASTIMTFFLSFGLLSGAAMSFLYTYLTKI
ncbi:PREDICTED: equilibrative nucleoside transporter 1-like isoform X2 [Amphimedon queenslandica]|nr:PREDICTED: equilibrative nucleoside transporter 1-like isoform X2 [Amphimedon queenslandica]|eukprot:XP_019850794.1 PREDICTED: equilibrative nucleoside transporter 1-like isoform X2 [Amphimedon queenslandica]